MGGKDKDAAPIALRREALAHADALYNLARYLAGNDSDAQDLVQDTYARALVAWAQFTTGSNLKAWLMRILRNLFIDRYRRQSGAPVVRGAAELSEEAAFDPRSAHLDLGAVTAADVEAAMMALPEASRTLVLLDLEGLTEAEVADVLGCAIGTVKSRLHRARAELRELLKDYAPARNLHGL